MGRFTRSMTSAETAEPSTLTERLVVARRRFFEYRRGASVVERAALAGGFAALTGLGAQLRIPLSFTPVPITLQTFAVLLAGLALGARWGGASQGLYAGLGAAGVPWFAGGGAGVGHVLGPTGGYIVGFVLAATLVGYVADRYARAREPVGLVALLTVANFGVIYGVGLPWLYGWLTLVQGDALTVVTLLEKGAFPFLAGSVVEMLAAAAVGSAVTPSESFGAVDEDQVESPTHTRR